MNVKVDRLSVSISLEKQKQIDKMAGESNQSRDWIINQAIDRYIELHEWQKEHIQQRLAKANGSDAVFHSSDAVGKMMNRIVM